MIPTHYLAHHKIIKTIMDINRVLEIDMDTSRNPALRVRIVKTTPHRSGEIPHQSNLQADIIMFREALVAAIILAENSDQFKKGEVMNRQILRMGEAYADADNIISVSKYDTDGNRISKVTI